MAYKDPGDFPPIISERAKAFEQRLIALESAPQTTLTAELQKIGIEVPPPSELSDDALTAKLWEIIHGLASLRVFLDDTDHLSDRALYEDLHGRILPDEMDALGTEDGATWHVSIIGGWSNEDWLVYLKYYADEEERQRWKAEWPGRELPPHEELPYDRDSHLPDCDW